MKIIFMGTPEFAVPSLDILLKNNFEVAAVVTSPDRPAGRGQQLQQSAVKQYAVAHNLPVLQPEKLKDENFINALKAFKADLQIVVAFRMLPEVVWNMPAMGTFNLHASLLPKYRGAAPINWAIINGEKETGVTTFKLKHEIDTGNVLYQKKIAIDDNMNAGELHDVMMHEGANLMLQTMQTLEKSITERKPLQFTEQNVHEITHAPKIFRETCRLNWQMPGETIRNFIRGLSPYPGAFAILKEKEKERIIKIFSAAFTKSDEVKTNGSVVTDGKTFIKVACA